jgi:hypothetical protein
VIECYYYGVIKKWVIHGCGVQLTDQFVKFTSETFMHVIGFCTKSFTYILS